MTDAPTINAYEPPKVWTWDKESGGRFSKINRPIAGPTHACGPWKPADVAGVDTCPAPVLPTKRLI